MKKSDIGELPEYFDNYINEVDDIELSEALKKYGADLLISDMDKLEKLGDKVYSPGKWTVKEIIQHMIDAERIFCYRALSFARKDNTALPGFEENEYTPASKANRRSLNELLNEMETVRKSSIMLFESFDDEMLNAKGVCSGRNLSVLSIGFVLEGHIRHHSKVLKDKYYPLLVE